MKLNKKGFTLVELLAVIVVLALLMVVATRSIGGALEKSKKSALKSEASKLIGKTYEDIQSNILDSNSYVNFTYDSDQSIAAKINQTSAQEVTLKDGEYTMYVQIEANGSSMKKYCIDDGTADASGNGGLKLSGEIQNGNSIGTATEASGRCTNSAG